MAPHLQSYVGQHGCRDVSRCRREAPGTISKYRSCVRDLPALACPLPPAPASPVVDGWLRPQPPNMARMTAVGFEPTPLRTGAWSQRLRPLGQTVLTAMGATCTWKTIAARERRTRALVWATDITKSGILHAWPRANSNRNTTMPTGFYVSARGSTHAPGNHEWGQTHEDGNHGGTRRHPKAPNVASKARQ